MQPTNKLIAQQAQNANTGKDIRQRLQEALRRFGYKQVDVSKETSELTRHTPLDAEFVAAGQN